eukprot:CAMPEP_0171229354 /NCGR_PEP_ID=MMETSP0790-20130122/38839_1 /TAXON_ID=2925 /ORGANISM="Alexandrium catenella, Strain OF101" /LENGTH=212 /DNA_ID=CAMNT_0011695535 /DNA_START=157 /DNA_END=795 /DNA_ORIENTATION=+
MGMEVRSKEGPEAPSVHEGVHVHLRDVRGVPVLAGREPEPRPRLPAVHALRNGQRQQVGLGAARLLGLPGPVREVQAAPVADDEGDEGEAVLRRVAPALQHADSRLRHPRLTDDRAVLRIQRMQPREDADNHPCLLALAGEVPQLRLLLCACPPSQAVVREAAPCLTEDVYAREGGAVCAVHRDGFTLPLDLQSGLARWPLTKPQPMRQPGD